MLGGWGVVELEWGGDEERGRLRGLEGRVVVDGLGLWRAIRCGGGAGWDCVVGSSVDREGWSSAIVEMEKWKSGCDVWVCFGSGDLVSATFLTAGLMVSKWVPWVSLR